MKWRSSVAVFILGWFLFAPGQANAQSKAFTIHIADPSENQTFYFGPSTLLYSIQIKGWVATDYSEPSLIHVRLEIMSGTHRTSEATTRLNIDGSFVFEATVNPESPRGDFTIAEIENGCENCHHGSNVSLPPGKISLRVTATEPAGRQTSIERHIVVDQSTYTTIPVRVVNVDQSNQLVKNIPVTNQVWLYLWRARTHTDVTDDTGQTRVRIETLSQAPTQSILKVEPTVVDGVLYESVEPVTITLAPSATTNAPVILRVRSHTGEISGKLNAPIKPIDVRAIRLADGASYTMPSTANGTFAFTNLPITQYLVVADERALALQGFASPPQTIDLTQSYSASIQLSLAKIESGRPLTGIIRDAKGSPLPFAWASIEKPGIAQANIPGTGEYELANLPRNTFTVMASAPGYYNQAQVIDGAENRGADFALTRRPETQSIAWGNGEIVVPPESQTRIENQTIVFDYGWLWGANNRPSPITIRVADATITIDAGNIALENFPDRTVWLYVADGTATVRSARGEAMVRSGEMLALSNPARYVPVPLNSIVVTTLHSTNRSPINPAWEPVLDTRLRDQLAEMGIGAAQITTFVTYFVIILVLGLTPLWVTLWWWQRHRKTR